MRNLINFIAIKKNSNPLDLYLKCHKIDLKKFKKDFCSLKGFYQEIFEREGLKLFKGAILSK